MIVDEVGSEEDEKLSTYKGSKVSISGVCKSFSEGIDRKDGEEIDRMRNQSMNKERKMNLDF